jgi:hypothetical protein
MLQAPTANDAYLARMACLLALAPAAGITLLALANESPNLPFVGLVALLTAALVRATIILPRGDETVFSLLWLALGLTLGLAFLGAFSFGIALLIPLVMLILAIASAPNRTGRSRAWWPYVAIQALAFAATLALPFLLG